MTNTPKFKIGDKLVYVKNDENYQWEAEILDITVGQYKIKEMSLKSDAEYAHYVDYSIVEKKYKLKPAPPEEQCRYFVNKDPNAGAWGEGMLYIKANNQGNIYYYSNQMPDLGEWTIKECLKHVDGTYTKNWKELTKQQIQRKFGKLEYSTKQKTENSKPATTKKQKNMKNIQKQSKFILMASPTKFKLKYKNSRGEIKDYCGTVIDNFGDAFTAYINGKGIRRFNLDGVQEMEVG